LEKYLNRKRVCANAANWSTDRTCENKDNRDNDAKHKDARWRHIQPIRTPNGCQTKKGISINSIRLPAKHGT